MSPGTEDSGSRIWNFVIGLYWRIVWVIIYGHFIKTNMRMSVRYSGFWKALNWYEDDQNQHEHISTEALRRNQFVPLQEFDWYGDRDFPYRSCFHVSGFYDVFCAGEYAAGAGKCKGLLELKMIEEERFVSYAAWLD